MISNEEIHVWFNSLKHGEQITIPAQAGSPEQKQYLDFIKNKSENERYVIEWFYKPKIFKLYSLKDLEFGMNIYEKIKKWIDGLPNGKHLIPSEKGTMAFAKYCCGLYFWKQWYMCAKQPEREVNYFFGDAQFELK